MNEQPKKLSRSGSSGSEIHQGSWRSVSPSTYASSSGANSENEWESVGFPTPGSGAIKPMTGFELPMDDDCLLPPSLLGTSATSSSFSLGVGTSRDFGVVSTTNERRSILGNRVGDGPPQQQQDFHDQGGNSLVLSPFVKFDPDHSKWLEHMRKTCENDPARAVEKLLEALVGQSSNSLVKAPMMHYISSPTRNTAISSSSNNSEVKVHHQSSSHWPVIRKSKELNFILFELLKRLKHAPALQGKVLDQLCTLVTSSEQSVSFCVREQLLEKVLHHFFDDENEDELLKMKSSIVEKLIRFIVILGTFSFSQRSLGSIFAPLRKWTRVSQHQKMKGLFALDTMRQILVSTASGGGGGAGTPRQYFVFQGDNNNASLIHKKVRIWPDKGLTFCVWFRVQVDVVNNNQTHQQQQDNTSPTTAIFGDIDIPVKNGNGTMFSSERMATIWSMRNDQDGAGLEILLCGDVSSTSEDDGTITVKRDLVIRAYSADNIIKSERIRGLHLSTSCSEDLDGWHWLVVTLSPASFMWNPRLAVYLDGKRVHAGKFAYPQSPSLINMIQQQQQQQQQNDPLNNKESTTRDALVESYPMTYSLGGSQIKIDNQQVSRWGFTGQIARAMLLGISMGEEDVNKLYDLHTRIDGSCLFVSPILSMWSSASGGDDQQVSNQEERMKGVSSSSGDVQPPSNDDRNGNHRQHPSTLDMDVENGFRRSIGANMYHGSFGKLQKQWDDFRELRRLRYAWRRQKDLNWKGLRKLLYRNTIFAWDAKHVASEKATCFDSGPLQLHGQIGGRNNDGSSSSPQSCYVQVRSLLSDKLVSIAGVQRLLPILLESIHHDKRKMDQTNHACCNVNAAMLARIISLLADLVSFEYCQDYQFHAATSGHRWIGDIKAIIGLIRSVMLRACPETLTYEVVLAVANLFHASAAIAMVPFSDGEEDNFYSSTKEFAFNGSSSSSNNNNNKGEQNRAKSFTIECLRLLFDFNIWASAPIVVQQSLFQVLSHHVNQRFGFIRAYIGVQSLFDSLRMCYYYNDEAGDGLVAGPRTRRRVCNTPLTEADITQCRTSVLGLIDLLMCSCGNVSPLFHEIHGQVISRKNGAMTMMKNNWVAVQYEEVKHLVDFCQAQKHQPRQIRDVLQFLLSLIQRSNTENGLPGLMNHIQTLGNLVPLWSLISDTNDNRVQVLMVQVIHAFTMRTGNSLTPRSVSPNVSIRSMDGPFFFEMEHATYLADLFERSCVPCDAETINAFFRFIVGTTFDMCGIPHREERRKENQDVVMEEEAFLNSQIRYPLVIRTLLQIINLKHTPKDVCLDALRKLGRLLDPQNSNIGIFNRHVFTRLKGWQYWLVILTQPEHDLSNSNKHNNNDVGEEEEDDDTDADEDDDEKKRAIREEATEVFCTALFHRMLGTTGGLMGDMSSNDAHAQPMSQRSTAAQWMQGFTRGGNGNGVGNGDNGSGMDAVPSSNGILYADDVREQELGNALAYIELCHGKRSSLKISLLWKLLTRAIQLLRQAEAGQESAMTLVKHGKRQLDQLCEVACETVLSSSNDFDSRVMESLADLSNNILLFWSLLSKHEDKYHQKHLFDDVDGDEDGHPKDEEADVVDDDDDDDDDAPSSLTRDRRMERLQESKDREQRRRSWHALVGKGVTVKSGKFRPKEVEIMSTKIPSPPSGLIWELVQLLVIEISDQFSTFLEQTFVEQQPSQTPTNHLEKHLAVRMNLLKHLLRGNGLISPTVVMAPYHRRRSSQGSVNDSNFVAPSPSASSKKDRALNTLLGSPFMMPSTPAPVSSNTGFMSAIPPLSLPGRPGRQSSVSTTDAFVLVDEPEVSLGKDDLNRMILLLVTSIEWLRIAQNAASLEGDVLVDSLLDLIKRICAELSASDVALDLGLSNIIRCDWTIGKTIQDLSIPPEKWVETSEIVKNLQIQTNEEEKFYRHCVDLHFESRVLIIDKDLTSWDSLRKQMAHKLEVTGMTFGLNLYEEEARKRALFRSMLDQDAGDVRKWKSLLREASITPESGFNCVSIPDDVLEQSTHWKLDRRENNLRMRLRLRRAFGKGSKQLLQLQKLERRTSSSNNNDSMKQQEEEYQMNSIKKTLSQLSLPTMINDSDDEEQVGSNIDDGSLQKCPSNQTISTIASSSFNVGEDFSMMEDRMGLRHQVSGKAFSSADWDVVELTSVHYAARNEQVLHSTECELIMPMCVVRGRLDLTTTHIYFYGDYVSVPGGEKLTSSRRRRGSSTFSSSWKKQQGEESFDHDMPSEDEPGKEDESLRKRRGSGLPTRMDSVLFPEQSSMDSSTTWWLERSDDVENKLRPRRWALGDLVDIHRRRYLLQQSAVEFFFQNRKSYMVNFRGNVNESKIVFDKIIQQKPPLLCSYTMARHKPPSLLKLYNTSDKMAQLRQAEWTEKWVNWEITTFEYLMHLNTAAGRTYNDLTQYPVFPWVLKQYDGEEIDLEDPSSYRDLSKPIGALEEDRLKRLLERKEHMSSCADDMTVPPFLYGSHYSSIGTVLYFLLRVEPFATYAKEMQSGRFDHADRLFHSVEETWRHCLTSDSDFKELTPEFFYFSEMFVNRNCLDLGERQDGTKLDNVILPPWANGSPERFVRINRDALEGTLCSESIHEWIDLIFGYKQRGMEAEKAHNLFYYLTYEDAVDLGTLRDDPVLKRSIEAQIANFGQTPAQLFMKPHPRRKPKPMKACGKPKVLLETFGSCLLTSGDKPVGILFENSKSVTYDKYVQLSKSKSLNNMISLDKERSDGDIKIRKDASLSSSAILQQPQPQREEQGIVSAIVDDESGSNSSSSLLFTRSARPNVDVNKVVLDSFRVLTQHGMLKRYEVAHSGSAQQTVLRIQCIQTLHLRNPWPYDGKQKRQSFLLADDHAIATCGHVDNSIRIHSTIDGRLLQCVKLPPGTGSVNSIVLDEESKLLGACCEDGTFSIWRLTPSKDAKETVEQVSKEEDDEDEMIASNSNNGGNNNSTSDNNNANISEDGSGSLNVSYDQEVDDDEDVDGDDFQGDNDDSEDGKSHAKTKKISPHKTEKETKAHEAAAASVATTTTTTLEPKASVTSMIMNKFWSVLRPKKREYVSIVKDRHGPKHWIFGYHEKPIQCAFINSALDLAGTCSRTSHQILLHTVSDGRFIRTLEIPFDLDVMNPCIESIAASRFGHIFVHKSFIRDRCRVSAMHISHMNGAHLACLQLPSPLIHFTPLKNGRHILLATAVEIAMYEVEQMKPVLSISKAHHHSYYVDVALSPDESTISATTSDGNMFWFCVGDVFRL